MQQHSAVEAPKSGVKVITLTETNRANKSIKKKKPLIFHSVCAAGTDVMNYFLSENNSSAVILKDDSVDESDRMFEANNGCNFFYTSELAKEFNKHDQRLNFFFLQSCVLEHCAFFMTRVEELILGHETVRLGSN